MQAPRTYTYNTLPSRFRTQHLHDLDFGRDEDAGPAPAPVIPPTIIHWTSDETRRKEYAQIDRQCKGLRGIWNRLFTRSGTRQKFYDEKEGSDAGSVRRIRLDLPDEGSK
jgi:hypothetical protein